MDIVAQVIVHFVFEFSHHAVKVCSDILKERTTPIFVVPETGSG